MKGRCVYDEFGQCVPPVVLFPHGLKCTVHRPPPPPVPDPARTLYGYLEAQGRPPAPLPEAVVLGSGPANARAARDAAMEAVAGATPQEWKDQARRAIWHLATTRDTFTPDDVWFQLSHWAVPPPPDPRALGPILMRALRAKAIEDTGQMVPSKRRHHTKMTVYRRSQK